MMMPTIKFTKDENGIQQVKEAVNDLANTIVDPDRKKLYMLVIRGFRFIERHEIPANRELFFSTMLEENTPYTIRLVKELKYHQPLLEFRVNWRGAGAFRAIFFEYEYEGQKVLVFTRATIKQQTTSSEFEKLVVESEEIYMSFLHHPEQYINLEGVNKVE